MLAGIQVVVVGPDCLPLNQQQTTQPEQRGSSKDLAYILYTSGKGCKISV